MRRTVLAAVAMWISLQAVAVPSVSADGYQGWIDQTMDLLRAEAGTPLPRTLELIQVIERSGRGSRVCGSLASDVRFSADVRVRVSLETLGGEPIKTVRFRFRVLNRGEDGASGRGCRRLKEVVVPEMTIGIYRFKLRGPLLLQPLAAEPSDQAIAAQHISVSGIFERDQRVFE